MPIQQVQMEQVSDGVSQRVRAARKERWPTLAAASACPLAYLLFVWHFSADALQFDDWSVISFVTHPTWGGLWAQHGETRIPATRLVFLAASHIDHMNTRLITLVSALVLIAAYALLLLCFYRYLRRPLTPVSVLTVGIVWFSLADVQNALWAFQVGWYLVLFWLSVMLFGLVFLTGRRSLGFALALAAAILGSLTWSQGFALWAVGFVALMWPVPRFTKRIATWVAAFLVTLTFYFVGYDSRQTSCVAAFGCRSESALTHPLDFLRDFAVLLGDVVPSSYTFRGQSGLLDFSTRNPTQHELIGALLIVAAVYVGVASIRNRRTTERLPLAFLLVIFGMIFAAIVTVGRVGENESIVIASDRYSMAGLVVVTGLIMYAWKHSRPNIVSRVAIVAIAAFLILQLTDSSIVGWSSASNTQAYLLRSARVLDNVDRFPPNVRQCEVVVFLVTPELVLEGAQAGVAEFALEPLGYNRAIGPPPIQQACRGNA